MICTVHLTFNGEYINENREPFDALNLPDHYTTKKNIRTCTGMHRNFTIRKNFQCTFYGSLCKYYHGNNFQTLSISESRLAVEQLSDELHLPFLQAKISRLDIADNIITDYHPSLYTPCIHHYPKTKRIPYDYSGTTLEGHSRTLRFYHKNLEAIETKQAIPVNFEGENVYRLEVSTCKSGMKRLPFGADTLETLLQEINFISMIEFWGAELYNVSYVEHKVAELIGYTNASFNDRLLLDRIRTWGGEQDALEEIKKIYDAGEFTSSQARHAKNKIRTLCSRHLNYNRRVSLRDELKTKIANKVEENKVLLLG